MRRQLKLRPQANAESLEKKGLMTLFLIVRPICLKSKELKCASAIKTPFKKLQPFHFKTRLTNSLSFHMTLYCKLHIIYITYKTPQHETDIPLCFSLDLWAYKKSGIKQAVNRGDIQIKAGSCYHDNLDGCDKNTANLGQPGCLGTPFE